MSTKAILCNSSALTAKYGAGARLIQNAVQVLILADGARGIQSRYIAVDDQATMQGLGGTPVTIASDPRQNKDAVDTIYRALAPDYILLLGSPDLLPHQDLANPLYDSNTDVDRVAWSDLPYACDAPYSQTAQNFIGPTRVLGRLPDVTGKSDPQYLINLLNLTANYRSGSPADYAAYLGATASVWSGSTALSLSNAFGNSADMQVVSPSGSPWLGNLISRRSHFFNCHGADTDPHFYGQQGNSYPVALDASSDAGNLTAGTVMAAEACYGAQLYAPSSEPQGRVGMANAYLAKGCPAYFGSTTIAYGGFDDNENADLLCQYFFESILAGASAGRAALEAKQRYAQTGTSLSPTDLKTLAQYLLLADPSLVPAQTVAPGLDAIAGQEKELSERRKLLILAGREIGRTRAVSAGRPDASRSVGLNEKLAALAQRFELEAPTILSFSVLNTAELANLPQALVARSPGSSEYTLCCPGGGLPARL